MKITQVEHFDTQDNNKCYERTLFMYEYTNTV